MLLEEGLHVEVDVHLYGVSDQGNQHLAAWVRYQVVAEVVVIELAPTFLLFAMLSGVLMLVVGESSLIISVLLIIELALSRYLDLLDP